MILSNAHKYIFIHCRKTAGSSVAIALARDLGPDDLQLSGLRESAELGQGYTTRVEREAREMIHDQPVSKRMRKRLELTGLFGKPRKDRAIRKLLYQRYRPSLGAYTMHAPAVKIRDTFPDEWSKYPKFCIVRNPYDKVISDYFWRTRDLPQKIGFTEFVHALRDGDPLGGVVPVGRSDNWPMYTIDDDIVVDKIIRYENMAQELPLAMQELGVPWDGWMPNAKGSYRPKAKAAQREELYSVQLRKLVGQIYEREIEAFGYEF